MEAGIRRHLFRGSTSNDDDFIGQSIHPIHSLAGTGVHTVSLDPATSVGQPRKRGRNHCLRDKKTGEKKAK